MPKFALPLERPVERPDNLWPNYECLRRSGTISAFATMVGTRTAVINVIGLVFFVIPAQTELTHFNLPSLSSRVARILHPSRQTRQKEVFLARSAGTHETCWCAPSLGHGQGGRFASSRHVSTQEVVPPYSQIGRAFRSHSPERILPFILYSDSPIDVPGLGCLTSGFSGVPLFCCHGILTLGSLGSLGPH